MLSEETHGLRRTEITDEGRDTWAEIERVVHPPSSLAIRGQAQIALPVRVTANLQTYINEMKEPSNPLFSLSVPAFTLFLHCQKLRYPRLDRARIKRNSRVSRIRRNVFTWFTYNSDQTTRRFEWTCVIAVRALLLYVHLCVRYVSTLPLGIFAYFIISVGRWKVMLVFVQRESR